MKRLTIEYIKSEFAKRMCMLVSDAYINNRAKLEYICKNNHRHSITWHDFEAGKGCPHCAGLCRLNVGYIREEFNKEGYTLVTNAYTNNKQKIRFVCPNGHIGSIRWDSWYNGTRCSECYGNTKKQLSYIRNKLHEEEYTLLSDSYIGNKAKLSCSCNFGHVYNFSWNAWSRGARCPICAVINRTGSGNHNWQGGKSFEPYCPDWKDREYKESIKRRDGYRCLNPYCCSKKPADLTVHHVDYNKKNCRPDNLITVCRSCNSTANTDRKWHTAWYQAIIYNRYKRSDNEQKY